MSKILFISGSIGLGHIGRDLAITEALKRINPNVDIFWLAEDPAGMVVKQAGENLLAESKLLGKGNQQLEKIANEYQVNLVKWTMGMRKNWAENAKLVKEIVEKYEFDLVVGDETYELLIAILGDKNYKSYQFAMIYDFIGIDTVTSNPIDHISAYMVNRLWAQALQLGKDVADLSLFIGQIDDIPNRKFGFMLPNRRDLAAQTVHFVGYITSFNPKDYEDKEKIRRNLGYDDRLLVICSIGGTSAGKELLDLCSQAYLIARESIAGLHMVLVCGPNLQTDLVKAPEGVEVRGYVPNLFMHLAAADLAIVTG
jgi:UDP-N-acetylglucosamine:LPS N-acetylglucosamine transferase